MHVSNDDWHTYHTAVYGRDNPGEAPSGWIQWKGTDVCMDLRCVCGAHGHIDGDFFYHYRCAVCGRRYAVGQNVKLIELTPEEIALGGVEDPACGVRTDPDAKID